MYGPAAAIYDRLYAGDPPLRDARAEAERVAREIASHRPEAASLLDVACGSGRYLPYLPAQLAVDGLDLNPDLLSMARARLPHGRFHLADMATFDLGRRFDVITCLFSSIAYTVSVVRLRATLRRFAAHLTPGGLVIIEPWFTVDSFWDGHLAVNHLDEPDLHVTWMYRQQRTGTVSVLPIHYLIATAEGIEHHVEHHELGLFTDAEYRAAMEDVGLRVSYDPDGFGRGLYVGIAVDGT